MMSWIAGLLIAACFVAVTMAGSASAQCPPPLFPGVPTAVTTYHYDNLRTGWNCNETTLSPANVAPPSIVKLGGQVVFGLIYWCRCATR